jgi:glycosyltransferase involved in cell wall biosynthesis
VAYARLSPKLRVLIVPDLLPWICGTIAKRIAYHNSDWIEATICSALVLRDLIKRCGGFPDEVDLVHFLTESEAEMHIDRFVGKVPCVLSIQHVESERSLVREPQCDAIAVSCHQWCNYLVGLGIDPEKIVMIPYGVDVDCFRPPTPAERHRLRERLGLRPEAFVVGFCAKKTSDSSSRKGIDTLLRAITQLHRRMSDVSLLIVGPGWSDLLNKVRADGLNCVHLPFIASHEEFAKMYRCLDTYWITSRIEGGPVPLLEAMSSGVPCVTTPVGMAPDLVRDGENGFLVPFDDAEAFIRQTAGLVDNLGLKLRMADAARRVIVDGYQWHQATRRVWWLYHTAIERFQARSTVLPVPALSGPPTEPAHPVASVDDPRLAAIPRRVREWVVAKEHFLFTDHLRTMGENQTANRLDSRLGRHLMSPAWRAAAHDSLLNQGWHSFMGGDRWGAKILATRSICRLPWRSDSWRLLACAFLKPCSKQI